MYCCNVEDWSTCVCSRSDDIRAEAMLPKYCEHANGIRSEWKEKLEVENRESEREVSLAVFTSLAEAKGGGFT